MGALAFMFLLAVVFFVALFFIILNIILIIIWNVVKRSGKHPKKVFVILPTVFLIISLLVEVLPVGWVSFLHYTNSQAAKQIVRAESGKILYWGTDENGANTIGNFEMDGTKYILIDYSLIPFSSDTCKLNKPIANVKYRSTAFEQFMKALLGGNDTSTLYPIENHSGADLYSIGSNIYCPANQQEFVTAYYNNITNYDLQNCSYEYVLYAAEKDADASPSANLETVQKSIRLEPGVFEKIYHLTVTQTPETIAIPSEYVSMQKEMKPGTPVWGYKQVELYAYSQDKVSYKSVRIDFINDQTYSEAESDISSYIKGYRLPDDLNRYIQSNIF